VELAAGTELESLIEISPLTRIDEIFPAADLAGALAEAVAAGGYELIPSDILVVTQKIVSKAEGRFVRLADAIPGAEAQRLAAVTGKDPHFVELVLSESTQTVRATPGVLITRHRTGHIMANAGIDRSNLGPDREGWALLLPEDPDASAESLRAHLAERFGEGVAVVISDSFGRPWRNGVVNVAIGASGLPSLADRRGERDREGRPLEVTQVALADMVAAAAGLAMGEGAESVPAALVRGLAWSGSACPASALLRPAKEDLFL
jgi:coenzyme F420-0:L-glutamate ligase/coenzyme F420-1:gamma-L-glutamate ligase